MYIRVLSCNLKTTDHFGDPDVYESIILKLLYGNKFV